MRVKSKYQENKELLSKLLRAKTHREMARKLIYEYEIEGMHFKVTKYEDFVAEVRNNLNLIDDRLARLARIERELQPRYNFERKMLTLALKQIKARIDNLLVDDRPEEKTEDVIPEMKRLTV